MGNSKLFKEIVTRLFKRLAESGIVEMEVLSRIHFSRDIEIDAIECHLFWSIPNDENVIANVKQAVDRASDEAGFEKPIYYYPVN